MEHVHAELLDPEFEDILFWSDPASGLQAVAAIHDTSLGPALGGIRTCSYSSRMEAVEDVKRLARGMTHKCALSGLPAGGGKVVVLDQPQMKRGAAFRALGSRIESLGGRLRTARDLGTTSKDLREVAATTSYVTTAAGISCEFLDEMAAEGVFVCAGTCLDVLGISEWNRVRIAIQGLGGVGLRLAMRVAKLGAEVIACDTDASHADRAVDDIGLTLVSPEALYDVQCEVFAPCAVGGVINKETIPRLRCRVVAGAANNQLEDDECGDELARRNILYAPDFIANAGAVMAGGAKMLDQKESDRPMERLRATLLDIVMESMKMGVPPHRIAMRKAEERWRQARDRRRASRVE